MSRLLRVVLVVALLLSTSPLSVLSPAPTAYAFDSDRSSRTTTQLPSLSAVVNRIVRWALGSDPNANAIAQALTSVSEKLDTLEGFEELGAALPLGELVPGADNALRLGTLFEESLKATLGEITDYLSLEELAGKIDAADGLYPDPGGVQVYFSGPQPGDGDAVVVEPNAGNANLIDVLFEVSATRVVAMPLAFRTDVVNLDGGGLSTNLSLSTVLRFQLDTTNIANLQLAFYLVDDAPSAPPAISIAASANGTIGTITSVLGFADITATGTAVLNGLIKVPFDDPDDDGKITLVEITSSAWEDLVAATGFVDDPATDAVHASINLDTSLVPGSPDGSITFVDPNISPAGGGLNATPSFSLGSMADLRNLSAVDALGALGRLVSWLNGLQSTGRLDVEIPFLGGTFSDALSISQALSDALEALRRVDDPLTPLNEANDPTFDDAVEMGSQLATALGLPAIVPSFDVSGRALAYRLAYGDAHSAIVPLDFGGELDVLSDIGVTAGGSTSLAAAYRLDLTFGLDLQPQPTESGAGIGSCEDGEDNDSDTLIDAADTDCATLKTLEQRAFLNVGAAAGTPELTAGLGLSASGVDAVASIGLLQAGINDASLAVVTANTTEGAGAGTCTDGSDNDSDGMTDSADPDCAFLSFDFTGPTGGRITIEDLFNTLGGSPPTGVTYDVALSASVDGSVPVAATLGGVSLAGGSIAISGSYEGPLASSLDLVNNISIDASSLATSDLFDFSPCSNAGDDDGDGLVNDGCPLVGAAEEGASCAGAADDDSDGMVNDGCPALSDPETGSTALLDKILMVLQALAGRFDSLEGENIGSSLSDPLPLLGKSFNDLFSYADTFQDLADELTAVGEDPATQCANNIDDDHDGVVNDGCPTQATVPESGQWCRNATDDEDNNVETAGQQADGAINDGCPPTIPTLQALETQIEDTLEDVLESIPGVDADLTSASVSISLDADKDLVFQVGAEVARVDGTTFNLDLGGLGGDLAGVDLVAVESSSDLQVQIGASAGLGFGLDLDEFQPFLLGSTNLEISGQADADDLVLNVSLGPLTAGIGTDAVTGETACDDAADDDNDGKINDGCAMASAPESEGQCTDPNDGVDNDSDGVADDGCGGESDPPADAEETGDSCDNNTDDDGDGKVNDGCPAVADQGRVHLGAGFTVDLAGDDDDKIAFADLDFDGSFDGVAQAGCPTATDHACAVLPLYFEDTPIGDPPDHQIVLRMSDISDPDTLALTYPDLTNLEDLIASQVVDMLLLESGLSRLLDTIASVLNGEIFGFDLPLIGDQLDEAANFVQTLDDELVAAIHDGGDPFDALSLTPSAKDLQDALTPFGSAIGTALDGAGILMDTNGDGTPDGEDFFFTLFCGDVQGCGIGPETACENNVDDDEDGKVNDGCAAAGSPETGVQCTGDNDGVDNDGDGIADDGCRGDGDPATDTSPETGDSCDNSTDDDSDGKVNDGCYADGFGLPAMDVTEIRFYSKLGQSELLAVDTGFDIGIPGLGLSSEGDASVTPSWALDLGFGINKNQGFFVLTQEEEGDDPETGEQCTGNYSDDDDDGVPNDGCPELRVAAEVALPDTLDAQLGFLYVTIVNGDPTATCADVGSDSETPCLPEGDESDPPSSFDPQFVIDLTDPGDTGDGRFSFAEMTSAPSFGRVFAYDFAAEADINLHIETSIAGTSALPKLLADLKIDWRWSLNGQGDAGELEADSLLANACDEQGETNCFGIVLDDVVVDAGSFLSEFLAPIATDIRQYTEPLQPVIDVLEAPIPVLSDFSGSPVTLLTLCEDFCPPQYSSVEMIIYIVKMVSFINGLDVSTAGGDMTIALGDGVFELNAPRLQGGTLPASEARSAFNTDIDSLTSILDSLGEGAKGGEPLSSGEVQNTTGLKSIGLSFPFLEQPSQLLTLLFGQDVDLIVWEPPNLELAFSYSQKFGPIWAVPPVFLEIGGSITVKGHLGIGYDTQGLREMIFEGANAWSLLNGLYLLDRDASGQDVPELELRGELFANAQVSVLIFSAGAGGSIYLTVAVDLVDPNEDGKLKFQEVASILESTGNPFCLFRLTGAFGVRIYVFAEVDLFFWSKRWEITLADIVLLSFSVQCDFNKVPILAAPESPGSSVLLLHMGPYSDRRGSGSVGYNATSEEFRVTQEANGSLTVVAFGYSENHPAPAGGWTLVRANAGDSVAPEDDEDIIALVDGAVGAETVCANGDAVDDDGDGLVNDGCPVEETVEKGNQCTNATDDDEDGLVNDGCPTVGELVPFTIPADLKGGVGRDQLTGSRSADTLDGGDGNDLIEGLSGNDRIAGGAGNDQIGGGGGDDTIYGDTAADGTIAWNGCAANAPQDPGGNDIIEAGLGADRVCGQAGEDTLIGGMSAAGGPAPAETGAACGNGLDDDADGAVDDGCLDVGDEMHGGNGADDLDGGDGGDTLYGDGGPDHIDGARDNDTLYGGDETSPDGDVLLGGPGADSIYGGTGADKIVGGNLLAGEPDAGDPHLNGEGDNDIILGDNATFEVVDSTFVFTLIDASIGGGDTMDGGTGDDVMRGQRGHDDMFGGTGTDNLEGNADDDFIFGDNGTIVNRATAVVTVLESGTDGGDAMRGNEGTDHMYGCGGADSMFGDDADDYLEGNGGNDTMRGVLGNDEMYGNAGTDTMYGDSGVDRLFGGSDAADAADAGDILYGNADADILIGDNGQVTTPSHELIETLGTAQGGADTIWGNGEDDILLGGVFGDFLWGNLGADIILGDNGQVTRVAGVVQRIVTSNACSGGADTLAGDEDPDILLGGQAGDIITGNLGADTILGDNGVVVRADGTAQANDAFSTDPTCGGKDNIAGNEQDDLILGGSGGSDVDGVEDGGDVISGNAGQDMILGDNGYVQRNASDVTERITSQDPSHGGEDTISGNEDMDILVGGNEDDALSGDAAADIILGDNGVVVRADGTAQANDIYTSAPTYGGRDVIDGAAGDDIILGGSGGSDLLATDDGDTITGDAGADIVLGDDGNVSRNAADAAERITATDTDKGGGDHITGDGEADILVGGHAGDDIEGNEAGDTILGDSGVVILAPDAENGTDIYSITPSYGGSDTIHGSDGDDLILGGSGGTDLGEGNTGDDITGDAGADIALGDNGRIDRSEAYAVERIATTEPCYGADDSIAGGPDSDILLGGNASDTITGDGANDTILGDNGVVVRADGSAEANDVYTTDPSCGGSDDLAGNDGDDVILGGSGGSDLVGTGFGDTIVGNAGEDLLFGDNAHVTRDAGDVVEQAASTEAAMGGSDTIGGNEDDDILLGGQDGDALSGDAADDVILGDHGELDWLANDTDLATLDTFESTSPTVGGDDVITGGTGDDIAFGGTASDTINGNEDHDILLGDHGSWDSARPVDQQFLCIFISGTDGGAADTIHGNGGDDFILGQQADDVLFGDADQDDLTGGHNVPGGADAGDAMYGESDTSEGAAEGSHGDVMIGDNGVINRALTEGVWEVNSFNGTAKRVVQLYDVEMAGMLEDPAVFGADTMYGNDNDDILYGQNGADLLHGGAGDDYLEGNADSDRMWGDGEDDDMLGGSGPTTSNEPATQCLGCADSSTKVRNVPFGPIADDTADVPFGDGMYGGAGSDVMLGDNGIVARPLDDEGHWLTLSYSFLLDTIGGEAPRHPTGGSGQRVDRNVAMVDITPGGTAGSDLMVGGAGDDDIYGQFDDSAQATPAIGDELLGNEGEDAMLGDQGVIVNWVVPAGSEQLIEPNEPFLDDSIYVDGSLFREVRLEEIAIGGTDRMLGGPNGDWMHGGAGDDLMNGNSGNDRLFGDDGDDVMWGGPHHDHLWGGWQADYLDVRPRPDDPAPWHAYATDDHYQDIDYVYGGWHQDAMQANIGDEGNVVGDRLIDWVGAYNAYYLCPGLYGEFVVTRDHSPAMITFLQQLSAGDGGYETAVEGTSGFNEVAMVFPNQAGNNSSPVHPDNPGHFVCREAAPTMRTASISFTSSVKKGVATVTAAVKVTDETWALLPGATVEVLWTQPDWSTLTVTGVTDRKGIAKFTTTGTTGLFTIDVQGVTLAGYTFDPDQSVRHAWVNTVTGESGH